MLRRALFVLAAAVAACGEPERPDGDVPATVGRVARGGETLVVLAIDGLDGARLAAPAAEGRPDPAPNLRALAAEAVLFEDHVAASTGLNGGLATLLTGLHAREHGVGSLRQRGMTALPAARVTLAEVLAEIDWRCLAAFAAPQLDPAVSGLDQGFATLRAPGLFAGDARTVDQVWLDLRPDLERELASGAAVFALMQLGDLTLDGVPDVPEAAPFLRAHLAPFAARDELLAAALGRFEDDPRAGVEALEKHLGRGRGSAVYAALAAAAVDARLFLVDRRVGELVERLRAAGRWERACFVVTATRGLPGRPAAGDAAFASSIARPALLVRFPGGAPRGRGDLPASAVDLAATVLDALDVPPTLDPRAGPSLLPALESSGAPARWPRFCETASLELGAAFDARFHVEENRIAGTLAFDRAGARVMREGELPEPDRALLARLRAALAAFRTPPTIELETGGGRELAVRWAFAEGYPDSAAVALADGTSVAARTSGQGGAASLGADARRLVVRAARRALPARLDVDGRGVAIDPDAFFVGRVPLSTSRLPRLPGRGEPWPTDPMGAPMPAPVVLESAAGTWWWLRVGQGLPPGAEVEVVVALHPPRGLHETLDWSAGVEVEGGTPAGRTDALVLRGVAPFEVQLSKTPAREFALAVLVDGRAVPRTDVRVRDRRFAAADELALYLPDWFAGVTDELEVEGELEALAPGALRLTRREPAPPAASRRGLEPDVLRAIERLGAGE